MRISMRSFCVGLLAGALWLGLGAGTARALSIDPNPLTEVRGSGAPGGSLSASLYAVSVEGNTAVFQLSVTTGTVTGIDVSMLFDSFTVPTVLDFVTGAAFAGTGIGGTAVVGPGGAEAQFDFAGGIGPGQTSRQLVVTFALPIQIGFVGAIDFDNGNATTRQYAVEAPEPAALALFALGLGGFVLVRRAAR
jgi:hypothetical protein